MKPRSISVSICMLFICACADPEAPVQSAPTFAIDHSRISVSGVSAGAYMANQYHIANSSKVSGAGLIAGGPYWCATGSVNQGLGPCMNGGDIGVAALVEYAKSRSDTGEIDAVENLNDDTVWIFHGANDAVIHADVPAAAVAFYAQVADNIDVVAITNIAAPHGMPTIAGDGACEEMVSPFLNNCGYDAAGELLKSVSTIDNPRAAEQDGELLPVSQPGARDAEMLDEALLFVPAACAQGKSCGLHIAFHGCQQSTEFVGDTYARHAGYNEWASTNDLLILYPQVAKSSVAPINPLGCWDWWGYTGEDYAARSGAQMSVVTMLVDAIAGSAN